MTDNIDQVIREKISKDRNQLIDDIRRIVVAESPSTDHDMLKACADTINDIISKRLGIEPEIIDISSFRILKYNVGSGTDQKPLTFVCHYDTVWQKGIIVKMPVAIDKNVMRGPGIFDMKSGIVLIVWAIKYLLESSDIHRKVNLVITPDEEVGSAASIRSILNSCKEAAAAFVLEPSDAGKLKIGRKGVGTFHVRLKGKASHSGLDPDSGISAISELARLIPRIESLQDRSKGTTVSVGLISGGIRSNVIPANADAFIDVRVREQDEVIRIQNAINDLKPDDGRVAISVEGSIERPPMEKDEKNLIAFHKVQAIAKSIGLQLGGIEVGGASDGNFISHAGIPVVDGLGAVGGGAHSESEHILIAETLDRIRLLCAIIRDY